MNTEQAKPNAYKPFSNGSEFEDWCHSNCNACHYGAKTDETPHCVGEHGLTLGLLGDGNVPLMALDFIGTLTRDVQENGHAFCTLKRDCNQFAYPDDGDEERAEENLKDAEVREVFEEAFQVHGYKLPELIRSRILRNVYYH